ncbi:chromosome partitioning protein ParA [Vibrio sp. S9_S30]|uniref:chromosome partitioning protein ParA n=1 Tax=Vibrio sp. S9_S30 TaxID=2720226 RepID=UPI00188D839D|nr:chromosome partitioning protein ParA [Vibrio sp. S9_S30]
MVDNTIQDERNDDQEEVVIIEERNKSSYIYISIAAILGLAIGGLVGAVVTQSSWQDAYLSQDKKAQTLAGENVQLQQTLRAYEEDSVKAMELALAQQAEKLNANFQAQLQELQMTVTELEKVNLEQEALIAQQGAQLEDLGISNKKLNRQADLQASVFERSREVFQREMAIRQELERLLKEQEALLPQKEKLSKECDEFLAGTSWDASSDACDKSDDVNSKLSQIAQMIEVNKLDLEQIKALSEGLGLGN